MHWQAYALTNIVEGEGGHSGPSVITLPQVFVKHFDDNKVKGPAAVLSGGHATGNMCTKQF